MCKQQGRSFCSELGADTLLWSKQAPLEKPRWIDQSSQTFQEVIQLTSEKRIDAARDLLASAPDFEMRDWFHVHAQNAGAWRNKAFGRTAPALVMPLDASKKVKKFESKLFARDNFKCLYCGCQVRTGTARISNTFLDVDSDGLVHSLHIHMEKP